MIFETRAVVFTFVAWMAAAGSAAEQVVLYSETFDADLGTAAPANDAVTANAWHFSDGCPSDSLPGHSGPGAARWGNPASCDDFGFQGSSDRLELPALDLTACAGPDASLALTFAYFLSLQENSVFDRARVEAVVDGGFPVVVADNGFGSGNAGLANLSQNSPDWLVISLDLSGLLGSGNSLVVRLVGETSDGIANQGAGFLVDDLAVVCDTPVVDLAVTQTADAGLIVPGQLLGYRITVSHAPTPKAGGPYSTSTSDDLDGPAYDFEDISTTGAPIHLSDDSVDGPFPIGFDFPFFDVDRTEVFVSSNGFLTFLPGQPSGCCAGGVLPDVSSPNGVIAGWWEDLNPSTGGQIHYATRDLAPSRRFIVQFTAIPHFFNSLPVTFQIKLFESDGRIEIHYQNAPSDGGIHTAGIEDDAGQQGVPFFRGTTSLGTPLAVRFSPGTAERASGVTVVDYLPGESIFSSAVPSQGDCSTTGEVVGETVTCALGDLEPGEVATIDIVVTTPGDIGCTWGNTVTVAAEQLELDPDDNKSILYLPVLGAPGIFCDGFESGDTRAWSVGP